jgi:hypothetical protein
VIALFYLHRTASGSLKNDQDSLGMTKTYWVQVNLQLQVVHG